VICLALRPRCSKCGSDSAEKLADFTPGGPSGHDRRRGVSDHRRGHAGPGRVGEIDAGGWSSQFWDEDLAGLQSELLFASDALLLGRVTYEGFAAAWPDMGHEEGTFAEKMNSMPKYVASSTKKDLEWNATQVRGDLVAQVDKLKRDSELSLLIYGSASLVQLLLQHELIDRYRLMIHPVVLGTGKALFSGGRAPKQLRLIGTNTTSKGVVVLDYERLG
jgi:dihydrofolate reductase